MQKSNDKNIKLIFKRRKKKENKNNIEEIKNKNNNNIINDSNNVKLIFKRRKKKKNELNKVKDKSDIIKKNKISLSYFLTEIKKKFKSFFYFIFFIYMDFIENKINNDFVNKYSNNYKNRKIFYDRLLSPGRGDPFDLSVLKNLYTDLYSTNKNTLFFNTIENIFYKKYKERNSVDLFYLSLKKFLEYKIRIKKFEKGYGQRTRNKNLPDSEVYLNIENIMFNDYVVEDKKYFLSFLNKNNFNNNDNNNEENFQCFVLYNNNIFSYNLDKNNNYFFIYYYNSLKKYNNFFLFNYIFFNNIFDEDMENLFFKKYIKNYFEKKLINISIKKIKKNKKIYYSLIKFYKNLLNFILFFLESKFKFFFFDFVNVYLSLYLFIDKKNLLFSSKMRLLKIFKMNAFTLYIDFVELKFKHLTDYRIKRQETFNKSYFTFLKEIRKNKNFYLWIFQKKFINKFFYTNPKYSLYYDINLVDYEVFYKAFMEFTRIKNKFVFILYKYNNNIFNFKKYVSEKKYKKKRYKYLNIYKYSITEDFFNNLIF